MTGRWGREKEFHFPADPEYRVPRFSCQFRLLTTRTRCFRVWKGAVFPSSSSCRSFRRALRSLGLRRAHLKNVFVISIQFPAAKRPWGVCRRAIPAENIGCREIRLLSYTIGKLVNRGQDRKSEI